MSAEGRFLPVATLLSDRQLLGESRHSSKEFICSVRSSLNDRFRLGAAGQIMKLRQAENDPERTFAVKTLLYLEFRLSEILLTPPLHFCASYRNQEIPDIRLFKSLRGVLRLRPAFDHPPS